MPMPAFGVSERSSRGQGRAAGSSRRPSRGIPEPPVRPRLIPAAACRRFPRERLPPPRASRGRFRSRPLRREPRCCARTALSCLAISSNVLRDHCSTTRSSADGSIEPLNIVIGRTVNETIRNRTDHCLASSAAAAMRPIDVGFAAVCGGQPADRIGPQRVAARERSRRALPRYGRAGRSHYPTQPGPAARTTTTRRPQASACWAAARSVKPVGTEVDWWTTTDMSSIGWQLADQSARVTAAPCR